MSERGAVCDASDEAKFLRMSAGARAFSRSEAGAFEQDLRRARAREAAAQADPASADVELRRASFEKWRLIHHWARHHPYRDSPRVRRPDQWRDALKRFRPLRDSELIDWLALQIEVAINLARGVQDMRPRDPGPTWLATLEYVANRKRKALAVLHWAEAAAKDGCFTVDTAWRARGDGKLGDALSGGAPTDFGQGDGGHEGVPFVVERKS